MAVNASFALKAGVWFRPARFVIITPDSRQPCCRCQAKNPLIVLSRFPEPALLISSSAVIGKAKAAFKTAFHAFQEGPENHGPNKSGSCIASTMLVTGRPQEGAPPGS